MSKTTLYIVVIIVLIGANSFLLMSGGDSATSSNKTFLSSEDLGQLNKIIFISDLEKVSIAKEADGWILNEKYQVDESFFNTLLSILQRIEVVREVGNWEGVELGKIELSLANDEVREFRFASNPTGTKSYFVVDGIASEVIVPGYRDNVVDIFRLHPDQWRNRMIFDGSWRSIQRLNISNDTRDPVAIVFDDQFFLVNGNPPLDSSAVVDYLNQFQYFEANEMISKGRFPQFDSLAQTDPMTNITIEDIKYDQSIILEIYPSLRGQAYHLVTKENEMMVIDAGRVESLLATSQDFLGSN